MAVDDVQRRFEQITVAFAQAGVPHAVVGGQAVAAWVATRDPDAVRVTKDVDILLSRADLPKARAVAVSLGLEYCEILGVGMFVERHDPHPRRAVHLVWAGEKVRPEYETAAARVEQREQLAPGLWMVALPELVQMKLQANRDQDRVHLRDMIDVGLVGRELLESLPPRLAERLEQLLVEAGR